MPKFKEGGKAAFDFVYHVYLYDDREADTIKLHEFKKGDILPEKLIERLRIYNPEHIDFSNAYINDTVKETKAEVIDLNSMNRNELEKYAKEKFNVDLDKRKSVKALIKEIESLA